MRVDLRVPPCQPVSDVVAFCQRVEAAGFSGVGFVDSQMYLRDTYVVMAQVLAATERLRVHPALTCPGARHTSVIASAAKTVQEFGPDRLELWFGRGGSAHRTVGLKQMRIGEMRQALVQIIALLNGEANVFELMENYGEPGRGPRMYFSGGKPIPIYMAAGGPLVARLAGELCDGVLLCAGPNDESISEVRGWVEEGAHKAGRDARAIHEWYEMRCLVRDTREEAVRAWSPNLPPILASDEADAWLAKNHIDYRIPPAMKEEFRKANAALRALYPEVIHIMDWEAAVRICQVIPYELQEAMGDRMAVLGTPEYVTAQMKALEQLDCHNIYLYPCWTFQLPEPELLAFQNVIGPAFGPRRYAPWQTMAS
jgi:5,10-methylenetetrahydromethanopterin reductase